MPGTPYYDDLLFLRFYVYIFVDLVKRGALTLVDEVGAIDKTVIISISIIIIIIIIITIIIHIVCVCAFMCHFSWL